MGSETQLQTLLSPHGKVKLAHFSAEFVISCPQALRALSIGKPLQLFLLRFKNVIPLIPFILDTSQSTFVLHIFSLLLFPVGREM